jgi:hypothetical protein
MPISEESQKPSKNSGDREITLAIHGVLRGLVHPHSVLDLVPVSRLLPHLFPGDGDLPRPAVIAVLEDGLARLREQQPDLADLLRARFWDGQMMQAISMDQGRSISSLYSLQARALDGFADILLEMERESQERKSQESEHTARNLPPPTYTRLFGIDEPLERLRGWLKDSQGPRLIVVEGLGGIGKTALLHYAVREALADGTWADLAWVSAVDRPFNLWEAPTTPPLLDTLSILEQIARQFGMEKAGDAPIQEKSAALQQYLARYPGLIVIDDLEAGHRFRELVRSLLLTTRTNRLLLTSRVRLPTLPGSASLPLQELTRGPSLELLRHEASLRGLPEPEARVLEDIYDLVGGHPLALKLVIGQGASLPLDRVLENLRGAENTQAENLLQRAYRHSWRLVSADAKRVLVRMTLFPTQGAPYTEIQKVAGLEPKALDSALDQLISHSLLFFDRQHAGNYSIHRLTNIFLSTLTKIDME